MKDRRSLCGSSGDRSGFSCPPRQRQAEAGGQFLRLHPQFFTPDSSPQAPGTCTFSLSLEFLSFLTQFFETGGVGVQPASTERRGPYASCALPSKFLASSTSCVAGGPGGAASLKAIFSFFSSWHKCAISSLMLGFRLQSLRAGRSTPLSPQVDKQRQADL